MKGWLFKGANKPLELIEKPDPVPGAGEVVLDVKAAGLCKSDVAALENEEWSVYFKDEPVILGHECSGVVSSVGEGVEKVKVGDRVGVYYYKDDGNGIGYYYDGAYATKILLDESQCIPLPDNVTFAQGAAATDAGAVSHHTLFSQGQLKPGMKLGIIGIGGLGQFAAGMAIALDCEVYTVNRSQEKRDLALELGCKAAYENVSDLAQHDLELIVDYAGAGNTTSEAVKAIAPGGRIVLVGMANSEITIDVVSQEGLIFKEVELVGGVSAEASDVAAVYDIMKTGKFEPKLTEISFDEIDEGLKALGRGEVKDRLVAVLP